MVVGGRDPVLHGERLSRPVARGTRGEARHVGRRIPELHARQAHDQEPPRGLVPTTPGCQPPRIPRRAARTWRASAGTRARASARQGCGTRSLTSSAKRRARRVASFIKGRFMGRRRGGSAWWSVGLIGFCRSLTAALLGHPKVRGSNPRPDTSRRGVPRKSSCRGRPSKSSRRSMVGGPGTAWPAGATLIGLSRPLLRQVGIALVGIGLLLFFLSFVPIFLAFKNFMLNPFGSAGSMFGSFFLSFLIGALGIILLGVGGFALRLGLVRPVTSYVATEAAPAIQTAATAFGGGIREAGFGGAGGARAGGGGW